LAGTFVDPAGCPGAGSSKLPDCLFFRLPVMLPADSGLFCSPETDRDLVGFRTDPAAALSFPVLSSVPEIQDRNG
jgi:hypothetical protein